MLECINEPLVTYICDNSSTCNIQSIKVIQCMTLFSSFQITNPARQMRGKQTSLMNNHIIKLCCNHSKYEHHDTFGSQWPTPSWNSETVLSKPLYQIAVQRDTKLQTPLVIFLSIPNCSTYQEWQKNQYAVKHTCVSCKDDWRWTKKKEKLETHPRETC